MIPWLVIDVCHLHHHKNMSPTLLVTITSGWLIFKAQFPWRLQNSTANYRGTKLYALGSSEDDLSFSSIDIGTTVMVNKLQNPPIPKHLTLSSFCTLNSWIITNMIMSWVGSITNVYGLGLGSYDVCGMMTLLWVFIMVLEQPASSCVNLTRKRGII